MSFSILITTVVSETFTGINSFMFTAALGGEGVSFPFCSGGEETEAQRYYPSFETLRMCFMRTPGSMLGPALVNVVINDLENEIQGTAPNIYK